MRRILGIDPGLRVTGFGILEARGSVLAYVNSGCIRTTGIEPCPIARRRSCAILRM